MNEQYLTVDRIKLKEQLLYPHAGYIVADAKLLALYPQYFDRNHALPSLYLKASERSKSLKTVEKIYEFFLLHNVSRSDTVHVFGGGLICDVAAYAVATFKRGCCLKLYPSTLLAMVDAAIGGKCAVNYKQHKNYIGAFYPAEEIILHPGFLDSLKEEDLRQGIAEMIKCMLIEPSLSAIDPLNASLPRSRQILEYAGYKMQLCAQDPHDRGLRRLLNYGHSFGHILEQKSNYRFKHGDCVIVGIQLAAQVACESGIIDPSTADYIRHVIECYPIPAGLSSFVAQLDFQELKQDLKWDKKGVGQKVSLILPTGIRRVASFELDLSNPAWLP